MAAAAKSDGFKVLMRESADVVEQGNRPDTRPKESLLGPPLAPWDDRTIAEFVSMSRIWIRFMPSSKF